MQFVYHNDGLQTKETSPKFLLREKGRLFSIKNDGTDSYPFIIKKDEILFGSGLSCDIRIHVVGVAEEHCSIVIVPTGKAYLNPLAVSESTYLNDLNVRGRVILLHNDIITIGNRRFRFQYPNGSSLTQFLSYEKDGMEKDSKRKVNNAETLLLLNSKRKSLPSRAPNSKRSLSFGIKRKSLDLSDPSSRKSLRRRVTFGPRLSPEEFDKRLPPASPLRRGSLPNRKRSILHSSKNKVTVSNAASDDKNFKHSKALKFKFTPECSTNLAETPVCNDKNNTDEFKEKDPVVAKRLLFSEVVKKPVSINEVCQKTAPSTNKLKMLNFTADKCVKKLECFSNQGNAQESLFLKKFGISSTGHANSPATIFISKTKRPAPVEKVSSECTNSADIIEIETNSCLQSSLERNHSSKVEICMLENSSDLLYRGQTSGRCNELKGTKQISKPPFKGTSSKSATHSSPLFIDEMNSNQVDEESRSSLSEEHVKHPNEESEKQFDSREAIKSLIFNSSLVSEISNNFGEASSSTSNCMAVIKQVVFALSMANAYHDYKNIIEDIIHSPQRSSAFEVLNKSSSPSDEIITDNQEELNLKDLLKKNKIFLQLINKYQPKLLSGEIQELLKDSETSAEFSPSAPRQVKRKSHTNSSSRQSFKRQEADKNMPHLRKKSAAVMQMNLGCNDKADSPSVLSLDTCESRLKSPENSSLLQNITVGSTNKGKTPGSLKKQKVSTSPSSDHNITRHLRSKHLKKNDEKLTISKKTKRKVSTGNNDLSVTKIRGRKTGNRSIKVCKLKGGVKPDNAEEESTKKLRLEKNDSILLEEEPKSLNESKISDDSWCEEDLSLVQSNCISEIPSEMNKSGIQEMKTRSKIRSKRKKEHELLGQNNALGLVRKSLKRKYSGRAAVMLKERKSFASKDRRRRRKSSFVKGLTSTTETSIRKSRLLHIGNSLSSVEEVDVNDSKGIKGRKRKLCAVATPSASMTKSRKRANSSVQKDVTYDEPINKFAFEDDPDKNSKNFKDTPTKSKPSLESTEVINSKLHNKRRKLRTRDIENESSLSIENQKNVRKKMLAIQHLSPNSKIAKKSPSKLGSGKREKASPKKRILRSRDISVELQSPIANKGTEKEEAKLSSSIGTVEKIPSKSNAGKRRKTNVTLNRKRRNKKSEDVPNDVNSPIGNQNSGSAKEDAGVEKLPSKTKVIKKCPSKANEGKRRKTNIASNRKRRNKESEDVPIDVNSPIGNQNSGNAKEDAGVEKLPSKTKTIKKHQSKGKDCKSEKRVLPKRMSPEKRVTRSTRSKNVEGKKNCSS